MNCMRGPAPARPMSFLLKKALNIFADSDPKLCGLALCLFPLCRSNTYRNDLLSTAVIFDDLAEYRLIFIMRKNAGAMPTMERQP